MSQTILVCGHGPGISEAVARKFGREGFSVALVARNKERLTAAAKSLTDAGVNAQAFAADLSDLQAVRGVVNDARAALGPIAVVHWNAYATGAGDLLTARPEELRTLLDVGVHGLIAAVQAAHADLKARKGGLLVTGGGLAFYDPKVDGVAVQWGAMGLAVTKAAQHKLTGLLHERLAADGIYVGEVVVSGLVKGTAFDHGNATLEPSAIADKFWSLFKTRTETSVVFGDT